MKSKINEKKLRNTTNAGVWAEEFMKLLQKGTPTEGTLIGWFSNAIMKGYDEGYKKGVKDIKECLDKCFKGEIK